ncbi:MAG: hypothetical protein R2715_03560 [Ilumatobacteraceae bacterium]
MPVPTVRATLQRRHDRDGDTCGVPDLGPEDLAECVEHAATEAEDDSPGLGVKAWLADTDDLPTLEVVIETAASVQRDLPNEASSAMAFLS